MVINIEFIVFMSLNENIFNLNIFKEYKLFFSVLNIFNLFFLLDSYLIIGVKILKK